MCLPGFEVIHKLFERSCELGLWRLTADKIAEIFGTRLNRRMRGKLATVIDKLTHYPLTAIRAPTSPWDCCVCAAAGSVAKWATLSVSSFR